MLRDEVRARLDFLRRDIDDQLAAATILAGVPPDSWPAVIAREKILQTSAGLHEVLDSATRELYRDANVALRMIDAVLAVPSNDRVLRGRALRLRAHGLHRNADGVLARATIAEAIAVLTGELRGVTELLHAQLFAAYLESETGGSEVLLSVRIIAAAFTARGDAKGALQAHLMEAAILFERRSYKRAFTVNKAALGIAEALDDQRQVAIALGNMGHCLGERAQIDHTEGLLRRAQATGEEAMSYLRRAKPIYEALGMLAEAERCAWGFACIARMRNSLDEARAELTQVREYFLAHGMYLSASLVGLDLIDVLVTRNRHDLVAMSIGDVLAGFARTEIPQYAIEAFERVQAIAAERNIDGFLLSRVRSEVEEFFRQAA